jgi:hypothetical protein
VEEFCRRYVVEEAVEEHCSRSQVPHQGLWVPVNVGMKRRGLAHSDMRPGEKIGEAVAPYSRVEKRGEERSSRVE